MKIGFMNALFDDVCSGVASSVASGATYTHRTPTGAWNDPPVVKENVRVMYLVCLAISSVLILTVVV
jgi:hypothetical protein